jgi:hypothetical protein
MFVLRYKCNINFTNAKNTEGPLCNQKPPILSTELFCFLFLVKKMS